MGWLIYFDNMGFCYFLLHHIRRHVFGCLHCEMTSLIHLMVLAAFDHFFSRGCKMVNCVILYSCIIWNFSIKKNSYPSSVVRLPWKTVHVRVRIMHHSFLYFQNKVDALANFKGGSCVFILIVIYKWVDLGDNWYVSVHCSVRHQFYIYFWF